MSELHKFIFDGLPVRGMLVRLTEGWKDLLARREANTETGAYPQPVQQLLGEMSAAGVLLQSNIKFNGAVLLQIQSQGAVSLAVVEVQPDLAFRATANVRQTLKADATFADLVSSDKAQGRCAITLDPKDRQPGQNPYQGIVALVDEDGKPLTSLADVLSQYMKQSEQLETTLVLAADDNTAAGLLIQRLPVLGENNLAGTNNAQSQEELDEHYRRISMLASSLKRDELLTLDAETILRRLFWEEQVLRFEPVTSSAEEDSPLRFACSCSRERVDNMLRSLGEAEVQSVIDERGKVEVGCDFCGQQYHYDGIDAQALFTDSMQTLSPGSNDVH